MKNKLEGKWFHILGADGKPKWQGQILFIVHAAPEDYAVVQLYGWISGEPSTKSLIRLSIFAGCLLYFTVEEMTDTYDRLYRGGTA